MVSHSNPKQHNNNIKTTLFISIYLTDAYSQTININIKNKNKIKLNTNSFPTGSSHLLCYFICFLLIFIYFYGSFSNGSLCITSLWPFIWHLLSYNRSIGSSFYTFIIFIHYLSYFIKFIIIYFILTMIATATCQNLVFMHIL